MKLLSFENILYCAILVCVVFVTVELTKDPVAHASSVPLLDDNTNISYPSSVHPRLQGLEDWQRPPGPFHVALQIGHLDTHEAPEELKKIRKNTGAQYGTLTEVAIITQIAALTKSMLEAQNIKVTILPTTIPPNFWADVFISLHADGSENASANGYKIASSWRDYTGKGPLLVNALEDAYGAATGMRRDPMITANMRGYYGFDWKRFEHSAHPKSVAAIVETGFLTNASDRSIIVDSPEGSATGIANGIMAFLTSDIL